MKSRINRAGCLFFILVSALVTTFLPVSLHAQEARGKITGTVVDANKSAVPGASVKITDVARGTTVSLVTNDGGLFQAPYLLPGTYQVVIEVTGFKRYLQDGVQVQINETRDLDIVLEVGGAQETVTVTAEASTINTADANLGQTVDEKRIAELPLVHGDPYTLMGLSPGATYTGSTRLDRPFEPTHIVGYAVDGTRGNRSDLLIDGAPSTATANANEVIASYVPPSDIVQEFKVQTATFDSQFGNTEGGVTSITIKSGTNSFHGSAYLWKEPGTWAANDFFGNARGQARPETFSNRFGGYISGPVRVPKLYNGQDKTFFLFSYEGIRDSRPRFDANQNVYVPTAALRNGDFSAFACPAPPAPQTNCVNIYDPLTRVASGSSFVAQQFAGNRIPSERINPVARAILTYFGEPKNPGLLGNIFDSTLTEKTQPYDNYTFRVDQNISSKNRMFVRGSWYNRFSIYNDYTGTPYSGVNFLFNSRQGVIDDVHTFDATTVLNVRYGFNRFIRGQDQEADARGFDLTQLGFPASFSNLTSEDIRRFPRIDFPTNTVLSNGMSNEFRPVSSHSVSAVLNKVLNTHSAKFGVEMRIYREDDSFSSNDQTGQFIFDNTYTRQNSSSGADFNGLQAFASFLLGYPTTVNFVRRADYSEYSKTWGFFVQDDWRVNNKLTLNLGLRYELETPLVERQNKSVSGFDFDYVQPIQAAARARLAANPVPGVDPNNFNLRGGLLFAGKDTGSGLYNTPKDTLLPRIGFAYQWNEQTVVRGGFGLFAGFLGERRGDVIQPGYSQVTTAVLNALPNGAPIPYTLSTPFANTPILEPVGNTLGRQTALGQAISFFNQNPEVSKQARWQISVQRELPGGWVAEAAYVGNHGYNIEIVRNINALPNQYLNSDNSRTAAQVSNNAYLNEQVLNPFQGLGTSFNNARIARSQLLRPYPHFGDVLTTNNDGKSWYHAAQFRLEKRFSKGYTISSSYTWSKWLQATEYLNPADGLPTKMISDQDSPHRFSFTAMYQLPFGKGRSFFKDANGIVNAVVGGWQIGGVYQMQSGFPIAFGAYNLTTAVTSGDIFYNGGEMSIPSDQRTTDHWFNTAVFTSALNTTGTNATPISHLRTLPFRFSNVRRDFINNVDLTLLKDIHIREGMKVQLRFELINAFNEPYFPAPVTNQTASNFGQVSAPNQDNYARRAQVGVKFLF
jgi:Carboxypeptidase regulatory-like domain